MTSTSCRLRQKNRSDFVVIMLFYLLTCDQDQSKTGTVRTLRRSTVYTVHTVHTVSTYRYRYGRDRAKGVGPSTTIAWPGWRHPDMAVAVDRHDFKHAGSKKQCGGSGMFIPDPGS
jgi:hypothetical protein